MLMMEGRSGRRCAVGAGRILGVRNGKVPILYLRTSFYCTALRYMLYNATTGLGTNAAAVLGPADLIAGRMLALSSAAAEGSP